MVYKSLNYILFFLLFLFSCSSDKLIVPGSNCIYRISTDRGVLDQIEYDKTNRCIAINASGQYPSTISYDKNKISGIAIKLNYGTGVTYDTKYDIQFAGNNSVNFIRNETPQLKRETTSTFTFVDKLISRTAYYSTGYIISSTDPPVPISTTTQELFTYDSADNLVKKETLSNGRVIRVVEYENYDDKINPLFANAMDWKIIGVVWRLHLSHPEMPICRNNPQIIKQTDYNYFGGTLDNKTTKTDTVFYKYNQNNLPIEISTSNGNYFAVKIEYKE